MLYLQAGTEMSPSDAFAMKPLLVLAFGRFAAAQVVSFSSLGIKYSSFLERTVMQDMYTSHGRLVR